tara:strand:+ start:7141 stop:7425 length:285 start_codon:yes stop_codon:yes gene_type:complete
MNRQPFINGPFKEAHDKAESFGIGFYYSYCFESTVKELMEAEGEYLAALSASNGALVKEKREEVNLYENILLLAADAYHTLSQPTHFTGSYHND